ncbi:MAG: hypothetical protein LBK12_01075 [Odoribacteraceae bacterium]|nr:hypothetical protein [Odoribacteraceae bacterium]
MKLLVFIMSVYIFCLAVMPCHCHGHEARALDNDTELLSSREAGTPDPGDTCTPFCACADNCHHASVIVTGEALLFDLPALAPTMISHPAGDPEHRSPVLRQPPKV